MEFAFDEKVGFMAWLLLFHTVSHNIIDSYDLNSSFKPMYILRVGNYGDEQQRGYIYILRLSNLVRILCVDFGENIKIW